jgi:hypothetical protein
MNAILSCLRARTTSGITNYSLKKKQPVSWREESKGLKSYKERTFSYTKLTLPDQQPWIFRYRNYFFQSWFLTTLSVSEYSVDDRMINEYGAVGSMRIGRGNQGKRGKLTPVPLLPPQITHDPTWNKNQGCRAVGSRWLTAWGMAHPD